MLPDGNTHPVRCLYDSGSDLNLIRRDLIDRLPFAPIQRPKPVAEFLNKHPLHLHHAYFLTLHCRDSEGTLKVVHTSPTWSGDFHGYDMILGLPWLAQADPQIRFSEQNFRWWPADTPTEDRIHVEPDADKFVKDLEPGEQIYLLYPKQDRPRPARGPQDSQRREILDTLVHLKSLVADKPELQTLPTMVAHDLIGALSTTKPCSPAGPQSALELNADGLPVLYQDYSHVFSAELAGTLPPNSEYDHAIDLEEGATPPQLRIYNLSQKELEILRQYLDDSLEKGWIQPSKSPAGAPILFVPKADGSMRLCVDYRGLNKITIKNRHPLPLISELLDRLSRAAIFTKLDLRDAYHRLRIRKGDEWKTAFKTRYGHFEYLVMPFGLANAPASFQAYIHKALGNLVDTICIVYLDDILIFSENEADHPAHVAEVLRRLSEWRLYAKLSKCTFHTKEVEFLGYVVTPDGVVMDQSRVQAIQDWQEPRSYRDVQVFLGFANFYRRFIQGYSKLARCERGQSAGHG